ncbi:MAG: hypothetical protein Q4D12_05630 [Bacteroidales bacterium]|nr:hypothetical protein [Bacteroidales bacterium]
MKKMILTLVAVFSMCMNSFAAEVPSTNNDRNIVALEKALNLDGYQSKVTEQAGLTLQHAVKQALENTDEQARNKEMKKAVLKNLRSVRSALDYTQYKKYVQVMNVTLKNYGLRDYVK